MTTKEKVLEIINKLPNELFNEKIGGRFYGLDANYEFFAEELIQEMILHIQSEVHEPKVKQLVWDGNIATAFDISDKAYDYTIEKQTYYNEVEYVLCFDCEQLYESSDYDQAKAYAQEHFENLIRSSYE